MPSVAGQVVFPPNYLAEVYKDVRAAGGVCIADEVQVGFGRLGTQLWGFETQGVVPDIVVLGKPIGNAFPSAYLRLLLLLGRLLAPQRGRGQGG